jgi:hypothetical protein
MIDPRWFPYMDRYKNVPETFFKMEYPSSVEECQELLDSLKIDEESINSQLAGREIEAKYYEDKEQIERHSQWVHKTQKAKQIKSTQIMIMESLQRDMCEEYGIELKHNNVLKEIRSLQLRIVSLESRLSHQIELLLNKLSY